MKDSVSIQIKEIRPDELSAYCHGLTITYGCATSLFGTILVAYVPDGICYLSFVDDNLEEQLEELKNSWPGATLSPETQQQTQTLLSLLQDHRDYIFHVACLKSVVDDSRHQKRNDHLKDNLEDNKNRR